MIPHLRLLTVALLLTLAVPALAQPKPKPAPASMQEIQLFQKEHDDRYHVIILLQGALPWTAVLDTGASDVVIPWEALDSLYKLGLISHAERLRDGDYRLADGRVIRNMRYRMTLHLGAYQLSNVDVAVNPAGTNLLLGVEALKRFKSFGIDHTRGILRLGQPR